MTNLVQYYSKDSPDYWKLSTFRYKFYFHKYKKGDFIITNIGEFNEKT